MSLKFYNITLQEVYGKTESYNAIHDASQEQIGVISVSKKNTVTAKYGDEIIHKISYEDLSFPEFKDEALRTACYMIITTHYKTLKEKE